MNNIKNIPISIYNKSINIIDKYNADELWDLYYNDYVGKYVYVRHDAKETDVDFVPLMENFIGGLYKTTDIEYYDNNRLFLTLETNYNNKEYHFDWFYKSVIPKELIDELINKNIPNYNPRKLVNENIDKINKSLYKKILRELDFDTIAFQFNPEKGDNNDTISKLYDLLEKMDINFDFLNLKSYDKVYLLILDTAKMTGLDKNYIYNTSLSHYLRSLEEDYNIKTSELLSYTETINLIKNKILNPLNVMYKPRKLLYENKKIIKYKNFK